MLLPLSYLALNLVVYLGYAPPQPNHSKVKGKNGVEFTFKGSDEKGNQIWVDGEGNKSPAGGLLSQKWQTERESKNESFKSLWNLA